MTFGFDAAGTLAVGDIGLEWVALQTPVDRRLSFPVSRLAQRTIHIKEPTMAIAQDAPRFEAALDPSDSNNFIMDFGSILEDDEQVHDWTLTLPAESVALGLMILEGAGRDSRLLPDDRSLLFWLAIDGDLRNDPAFDLSGTWLPVEVSVVTNSIPSRPLQRTALVRVAQL